MDQHCRNRLAAGTCFVALTTIGLTATSNAFAEDTLTIPEVLVTAGAEPVPTKQVASSFTIITREEIQRHQYRSLVDALKSVPGMSVVQSGGAGTQTSVFMRGTNSNQTLVMLDGHNISDPSSPNGAFDFANFSLQDIERIEVVRGPQSGQYGSQAIGGVINIITRSGAGKPSANLMAEGGTLGTANVEASSGGKLAGIGYFGSFGYSTTNGSDITPARLRNGVEEEKDGNTLYSGSLKLNADLTDNIQGTAFAQYSHSKTDLDAETPEDLYNYLKNDELLINAALAGEFLDGSWMPKLSGSYTWYDRNNIDNPDYITPTISNTTFKGARTTARIDNTYLLSPMVTLNGGASFAHESVENGGYQIFSGGYRLDNASDADTNEYAAFASANLNTNMGAANLFGTANVRYDMPDDFDNKATFTIAPGIELPETGTRFVGSFGTAFKTPSLYQRFGYQPNSYASAYYGNNDLDPEESWGFDIGFEQALEEEEVSFGATYFNNLIKNGIVTVYLPSGDSTSVNADTDYRTQGVEAFFEVVPAYAMTLRIDYTYTLLMTDDWTSTYARRPRHQVNAKVSWTPTEKLTLAGNFEWVDVYRDIPRVGWGYTVNPAPYGVINLSGAYKLTENVTLTARAENATGLQYEPARGFQAAGFQAFGGVELNF